MIRYPKTAIAKPRMTQADSWKKRPVVLRYWDYKDDIKNWGFQNDFKLKEEIYVKFYIPMPKSWSIKKKAQMLYTPHQQRPDIDNYVKFYMDCMNKVVYLDDSQVIELSAKKIYNDKESFTEIVI